MTLFATLGTIDNNDVTVNFNAIGIDGVVSDYDDNDLVFTVEVNGEAAIDIDMTSYIRAVASDTTAVSQEEVATALQAAFDANFSGDNAITVTAFGDGTIGFDVAGGHGYMRMAEYAPIDGSTAGTFLATAVNSGTLVLDKNVRYNDAGSVTSFKGDVAYSDKRTASATPLFELPFSSYNTTNNAGRVELFSDTKRPQTPAMALSGTWAAGDTVAFSTDTSSLTLGTYTVTAADEADTSLETLAQNLANHINTDSVSGDVMLATAEGANLYVMGVNSATVHGTLSSVDTTAGTGALASGAFSTVADIDLTGANVLTVELDNSGTAISLTLTDGDYSSIENVAAEINLQIARSGQFEGDSAISAVVLSGYDVYHSDTPSDTHKYLSLQNAAGLEIEVAGNFVTTGLFFGGETNSEVDSTRILSSLGMTAYGYTTSGLTDGGVDTTAGSGIVSVSIVDGDTTIARDVTLGIQSDTRSFSDFSSDLATAVNAAFADDGYSVTASYSDDGSFSLTLDQSGAKTLTLSGTIVEDAFGSTSVSATGYDGDVVDLASMDDVVTAINSDLTAAGMDVAASFDSAAAKLVFTASGGDAGSASTVALSGTDLTSLQFGSTLSATGTDGNATDASIADIDVSTEDGATAALTSIDNAITYVSSERSKLGAIQNRLDHTVSNLTNVVTNTEASRSRIMDADYGQESAALAKAQIIQQAATAMLAQANQSSQSVLSLLQ